MFHLREKYPKAKKLIRDRTEALAADAAADEQLALVSWIPFQHHHVFASGFEFRMTFNKHGQKSKVSHCQIYFMVILPVSVCLYTTVPLAELPCQGWIERCVWQCMRLLPKYSTSYQGLGACHPEAYGVGWFGGSNPILLRDTHEQHPFTWPTSD